MRRRPLWLLVGLGLGLAGCANDVTDHLIEAPLGALSKLAIDLQFRMEPDPLVHGWVNQLGAEQRALVRRKNVPYRFSVVDLEAPNAFAIPWGGVYVTKGLLRFADSEDEIAFVMGHELGHVERRHSSLAFQRNLLINLGLALVTSNNNRDWLEYAYVGNYFLDLHFSRQNEHSADREGALYAVMSGHDPAAGLDFFHKLDRKYGATPRFWSYFETHPINRDRISHIKAQPTLAEDGEVLQRIADGFYRRSLFRQAEGHYQRVVKADPERGEGYLGLARIAARRGDLRTARERYNDALRHGVPAESIQAEVAALPAEAGPPPPPKPARSAEVSALRQALEATAEQLQQVAVSGEPVWSEPLDAGAALIAGHRTAGRQLDDLYARKGKFAGNLETLVVGGQKLRAAALREAAEVGAAQDTAALTWAKLEDNRQRLLARLATAPTAETVLVARWVLADTAAATRETLDGVQRLNELTPAARDAVNAGHQAIGWLHQTLTAGRINTDQARRAGEAVEAAQYRLEQVMDAAGRPERALHASRVRALESSIDITLIDRPAHERQAARAIIKRFLLIDDAALEQALASGLSYGEAAYVLGLRTSSGRPLEEILKLVADAGERPTVTRLDRRQVGRTDHVSILLKLIDNTLRAEFDPPPRSAEPPPTRPEVVT